MSIVFKTKFSAAKGATVAAHAARLSDNGRVTAVGWSQAAGALNGLSLNLNRVRNLELGLSPKIVQLVINSHWKTNNSIFGLPSLII